MIIRLPHACPRRLGATALLAALLSACGEPASVERFFPLEPGQTWIYRVERTTMDGTAQMRHAITSLVPPTSPPGISAARESLGGQRYLYRIDERGVWRLDSPREDADAAATTPQLVLPRGLAPTSSWQSESRTSVLENTGPPWETLFRIDVALTMNYTIESMDGEITTPAGRFGDCLVIRGHGTTNADVGNYIGHTEIEVDSREWFAPGIGLVRMERTETTAAKALSSGRLVMELDRWNGR